MSYSPQTSQEKPPQSTWHPARLCWKGVGNDSLWPQPDVQLLLLLLLLGKALLSSCQGQPGRLHPQPDQIGRRYSSKCSLPACYRLRNKTARPGRHRLGHILFPLSHLASLVTLRIRNATASTRLSTLVQGGIGGGGGGRRSE
jgi:hypothetical protein